MESYFNRKYMIMFFDVLIFYLHLFRINLNLFSPDERLHKVSSCKDLFLSSLYICFQIIDILP